MGNQINQQIGGTPLPAAVVDSRSSLLPHAILFLDLHDRLQTATGPRNQGENLSARQFEFAKLTADATDRSVALFGLTSTPGRV